MQTATVGKRDYRIWVRTLANGQRIAVASDVAFAFALAFLAYPAFASSPSRPMSRPLSAGLAPSLFFLRSPSRA